MRKYISFLGLLAVMAIFSGCIKNDPIVFEGTTVEMDAAAYNARSAGVTYPLLTRMPGYGRTVLTSATAATSLSPAMPADPLITRTSGLVKFRVNLVGKQSNTPITIKYNVLPASNAVASVHYTTSGTVTIPANSSFGEIAVQILDAGASAAGPKTLVLELATTDGIVPSERYKAIGISIAQN